MFARVTRIRKLISLLGIALIMVAGVGFARATSAHVPGLTMVAAPAPCDHTLSEVAGATEPTTVAVDVCAALCKTTAPDGMASTAPSPQKSKTSPELPILGAAANDVIAGAPTGHDARPLARQLYPPPTPALVTSRRLLI